jgi:hypothetical protein
MTIRISRIPIAAALVAALCTAAPLAFAHTTIKAQATEGVRDDNAVRIGHGCEDHAVIAQSVVFPGESPEIATSEPAITLTDLGEVIQQSSLAGLVGGIQDRGIFERQRESVDPNGNVVGLQGWHGWLAPTYAGRVPFQFTPPNFLPESCATKLRIVVAIADVCKLSTPTLQPEKVNLWIPDNGSVYAVEGAANGVEGIGAPAVLTVNRNLTSNPLDASCGAGFEVTITPSAAQIDRDLPIPRVWRAR